MPQTFSFEQALGPGGDKGFTFGEAKDLTDKPTTGQRVAEAASPVVVPVLKAAKYLGGVAPGAAEALVSGATGFGEQLVGGVAGLARGAGYAALGKSFWQGFGEGKGSVDWFYRTHVEPYLDPETHFGKDVNTVFGKIGAGIRYIGEKLTKATMDGGTVAGIKIAPHPDAAPYVGAAFEGIAQGVGIPAGIELVKAGLPALARPIIGRVAPKGAPEVSTAAPAPRAAGEPSPSAQAESPAPAPAVGPLTKAAAAAPKPDVPVTEAPLEAAVEPEAPEHYPNVRVTYPNGQEVTGPLLYQGEMEGKPTAFVHTEEGVHMVQPEHQAVIEPVGEDHAEAVRGHQGELPEAGQVAEGSEEARGHDLQRASETGGGPNGPELRGESSERPNARGEGLGRATSQEEETPQPLTTETARGLLKRVGKMDEAEKERTAKWINDQAEEHARRGREIADWCLGKAGFSIR